MRRRHSGGLQLRSSGRQIGGARYLVRGAQRLAHQPHRRRGIEADEQHGRLRFRPRQDLDRDLFERRQRAVGPGHQLAQIIAGDVFDDLAAGLEDLAATADRAKPEEMVARRAGLDAARSRRDCRRARRLVSARRRHRAGRASPAARRRASARSRPARVRSRRAVSRRRRSAPARSARSRECRPLAVLGRRVGLFDSSPAHRCVGARHRVRSQRSGRAHAGHFRAGGRYAVPGHRRHRHLRRDRARLAKRGQRAWLDPGVARSQVRSAIRPSVSLTWRTGHRSHSLRHDLPRLR